MPLSNHIFQSARWPDFYGVVSHLVALAVHVWNMYYQTERWNATKHIARAISADIVQFTRIMLILSALSLAHPLRALCQV